MSRRHRPTTVCPRPEDFYRPSHNAEFTRTTRSVSGVALADFDLVFVDVFIVAARRFVGGQSNPIVYDDILYRHAPPGQHEHLRQTIRGSVVISDNAVSDFPGEVRLPAGRRGEIAYNNDGRR